MSSSSFQILRALNTQLMTVAGLPALVFMEDDDNTTVPASSDTFIQAHNMPTSVDSPTLDGGYEVDTGIYQVSIFTPRGSNCFPAQKIADNIKTAFERGLMLDVGTAKLRFRKVEAGRGDHENGSHYMLPVSVYWQVIG